MEDFLLPFCPVFAYYCFPVQERWLEDTVCHHHELVHTLNSADAVRFGSVRKTSSDQLLYLQQADFHQLNCLLLLRAGAKNVPVRLMFLIPLLKQYVTDTLSFFPLFGCK